MRRGVRRRAPDAHAAAVRTQRYEGTVSPAFIEAMRRNGVDKETIEAALRRNRRLRGRAA